MTTGPGLSMNLFQFSPGVASSKSGDGVGMAVGAEAGNDAEVVPISGRYDGESYES